MKRLRFVSTAVLLLLLGTVAPTYAQQEQHEQDAKAPRQEQQAKPEKQPQQAKVQQPQQQKQPQQAESNTRQEQQQQAKVQQERQPQQHTQRSAVEEQRQRAVPALRLSARSSSRIPDDRFRANFGEGHTFVINQPVIVGGYSRFQYGGFWFGFVNPWPVGWYYTDAVYVDYIDGSYYLCDPYYPGARVAISVVL